MIPASAPRSIPLARPDIREEDIAAVVRTLGGTQLSLGDRLTAFEQAMAAYIGVEHAVAVSSGTAALHVCVRALGIGSGDEVITTPFSFIASANCLLYESAIPRFADIDPISLCIDPNRIEALITEKTKAILAVDIFGRTADWDALEALAERHNLALIEDSCEALGTRSNGRYAGSFGDCATLGFYPNKQLTTGEGGMLTTNNSVIADYARSMRNQGRVHGVKTPLHDVLGYNYRISEINCALGISQLERLDSGARTRRLLVDAYNRRLSALGSMLTLPSTPENTDVHWFVYAPVLDVTLAPHRDSIMEYLRGHGIECTSYFHPIHLQPLYIERFGYRGGEFPVAESVSDRTVVLPLHLDMTEEDIEYIASAFTSAIHRHASPVAS